MPKRQCLRNESPLNFDDVDSTRDLALILAEIQNATDSIVLLVRGAIALDNLLTELLDRSLHFENNAHGFDQKYRLFFAGKCDLAMASGSLSRQERDALRIFNRFRNRAAHGFDVHVHEKEVEMLVRDLKKHGWSPPILTEGGDEPSPIEALRAAITTLVGLLILRIAVTGKVTIRGEVLDKGRWLAMYAVGTGLAMTTIARERVIRARNEAAHELIQRVIKGLESDDSLTDLSDEELSAELNRRIAAEADLDLSKTIESAEKEVKVIADKLSGRNYKITLGYTPGPITVKLSRRGGRPAK